MSSISIDPTVFKNARTGAETKGVIIYDDYGKAYENTWDEIPADDLVVLAKTAESEDPEVRTMIQFLCDNEEGATIGGKWYDWSKIKGVLGY
jgi:hypothetical protein